MAPILGYWDIRGLAEPIRLLLNYTETEFKDERYELGDAPEYNAKAWTSVKYTLGLPFPNLPYYIDGDTKISQSNAILRHIARKHDLCGTCEEEKVMVDVAENQLMDFRKKFTGLCYNQDFDEKQACFVECSDMTKELISNAALESAKESTKLAVNAHNENEWDGCKVNNPSFGVLEKLKDNYLNDVKPIIEQFAKFLGEKKFVAGDKITFVDFILYEIMDEHQIFDSTLLEPHENLKDFLKRIEELPTIAAYLKSDRFKARPINNKMAKFK